MDEDASGGAPYLSARPAGATAPHTSGHGPVAPGGPDAGHGDPMQQPTDREPTRGGGLARGTLAVAAGLGVAQVLGYALNLVAARALGPDSFGAFAALMGVVLIGNVVAIGLQAVGARRLAVLAPAPASGAARTVLREGLLGGVVVLAVTAALTPVLAAALDLGGWLPVLLVAAALLPLTVTGAQLAVAQGREAFTRLGLVYVCAGVGKSGGGIAGAVVTRDLTGALLGFALGAALGALAGRVVVAPMVHARAVALPRLTAETLHATHAMLALFVLTNLDVLLARAVLPAGQAGEYAVGSVVTKVAFWLPYFVTVVAYPRLARGGRRAAGVAVALVAVLGLLMTGATAALSGLVVAVAGGSAYVGLTPYVWLFALEGSLFAIVQVLLYGRLAHDDRRAVVAVWGAAALLTALALAVMPHTVPGIALSAVAAGSALTLVGLAALRRTGTGGIAQTG